MSIMDLAPDQRAEAMVQKAEQLSAVVDRPDRAILLAAQWIIGILARPIALTTQALWRKGIGERYFTPLHALLGIVLIVGALVISVVAPDTTSRPAAWIVGVTWLVLFAAATAEHFVVIYRRYQQVPVVRWHSRCLGFTRINPLTPPVQMVLQVALIIFSGYYGLKAYAALLFFSLAWWLLADNLAAAMQYWRWLDRVDAQIEAEHYDNVIENRLEPNQAEGLKVSLPAYISDSYRRKVLGRE